VSVRQVIAAEAEGVIAMIRWNPGNVALFTEGAMRLYQPHYRRNLLVDAGAAEFFSWVAGGGEGGRMREETVARWDSAWRMKDATRSTVLDHAYRNSAMFDEDSRLTDADAVSSELAVNLLENSGFLAATWPIRYELAKTSPFDRFKGSFYEQIGTECLFARKDPTEWWTAQKFEDDFTTTRPTPYRFIQDHFLTDFLSEKAAGRTVLEVGCGTGYYTNKAAQVAELAVGIDYNANYVAIARERWQGIGKHDARFEVADIIELQSAAMDVLAQRYDLVFLIDTFLFLFHESYQPELYRNRETVVRNLASLVAPGGRLIVMDPHPLFLTAWFGDPNRPVGILEAYRSHDFRITPTLEEVSALFSSCGLAIDRVHEPRPDAELFEHDPSAFAFYSEVPPWWVFELMQSSR
jgi:SAM-dependent methyltransferase